MKKKWKCFVLDELPQIATKTMTFYDKIRQKKIIVTTITQSKPHYINDNSLHPLPESNQRLILRRDLLYPLN